MDAEQTKHHIRGFLGFCQRNPKHTVLHVPPIRLEKDGNTGINRRFHLQLITQPSTLDLRP